MTKIMKRYVRFSDNDQVRTIERLNPDDIWVSQEEASASRMDFRSSIMEQRKNITFIRAIWNIYSHCIQGKKIASPKVIADFVTYSDLRGLEYYAIKSIHHERVQQRRKLIGAILQIQKRIKEEGLTLEDDSNGVLAKVAEAMAAPAKAVARTMGQIDAISAKQLQSKRSRSFTMYTKQSTLQQDQFLNPLKRVRLSVFA
mmetsp:Transcript_31997/g.35449  ORF Transcript_31997/g.35449 Transcript_31997/m.35449 type:complete len:200 (-) Transcript_31997:10-609(-)